MIVTPLDDAPLSLASAGCSNQPLFSASPAGEAEFSIVAPSGSLSFDWSDFPVLSQYNEDMPVPPAAPLATAVHYSSSPLCSYGTSCSMTQAQPPQTAWDTSDDDTSSLSISSDEDTVVEVQSEVAKTNRDPRRRSIRFSVVEIRTHNVILGDHPFCSSLPIQLGWEHEESEVVDFDLFEQSRRYQRRHLRALRLTYWDRRKILEQSTGFSEEELLLEEQSAWRGQMDDQSTLKKVSSMNNLPAV